MPHVILLFIGLLFIGCGTEISNISKDITKSANQQSIEGNYTLKKGIFSYKENITINKVVNSSDLIIEKLDDDDYGYYFTMQVENLIPTQEVGIFHKKDDGFYKRLIYSTDITKDSNISIDSKISDEHLKTEITDKIELSENNNTIKIAMKLKNGGEITIIWTRNSKGSEIQNKQLTNAKNEYKRTYKDRFLKYFKDI